MTPAYYNYFAPYHLLPRLQCEGKGHVVETTMDRIIFGALSAGSDVLIRIVFFITGTPILPTVLPVLSSTCLVFWLLAFWPRMAT